MPQPDNLGELWRLVVALELHYDKIEALVTRLLAVLEARERPPQPPPLPPLH
jgi:hypothetical protein